ncbi:MAG: Gfo/Idh/MocA family oxidoreductase, partial [Terrimicrobiaceae bacterium]|nr:Gfo/Idh/MocA family oxidoreductase [Terrimicrobiaceae bacterium]
VWGQKPERGRQFAAGHGAKFVPEIEANAAKEDIDAVTNATPSGAHAMAAIPCLRAGKAVLCEKPLEVTLEKIDAILEAARAGNALLGGVLQLRLGAGARALKQAVERGRFGRLALASAYLKWWREQSYYDAVDWRGTRALDGGGALMNQGIHVVDLLQWLVGMPSRVSAFAGCVAHERIEVEDTLVAALRFPGGAMGTIEASTACKPGASARIEICGDQGSALLEDDRIVRWEFDTNMPGDEEIRSRQGGAIVSGAGDPRAIGFEGHRILIEDLCHAIAEKRQPLIPGAEARNAVRLILSIYRAVETGQPAALD